MRGLNCSATRGVFSVLLALGLAACQPSAEQAAPEPPDPAAVTPTISSISPNPLPASAGAQTLSLNGQNFLSGASVTLINPLGTAVIQPQDQVNVLSSSVITVALDVGNQIGRWSAQVTNAQGRSSNAISFDVVATSVSLPTIVSISPDPMTGAIGEQTLTITGTNFDDEPSLAFVDPEGVPRESTADKLTRVSDSEIQYELDNARLAGLWQVRVINSDGATTALTGFLVENPRRMTIIHPGPNANQEMLDATNSARPGDTIEFACGFFDFKNTIQLSNTEDIHIKGCGKDGTVISFLNNTATPEGLLADNVRGLVVEDLTLADSAGNGIELRSVDHATLRRVRTIWSSGGGQHSDDPFSAANYQDGRLDVACTDPPSQNPASEENAAGDISSPDYTPDVRAGRYGIYPVKSRNILVTETESVGASDAGIYVGQSSNSIIEKSRAAYNVLGFEIENVPGGEYRYNLAECNTGGFLVYDLDGLTQYGSRTRMYENVSRNNNTYNFAETGSIVSQIPNGSGMITLAYDQIDVFDNSFENNDFAGIIHISYELLPDGAGRPTNDRKIDYYTEGMHIFRNRFVTSGNNVPAPTAADATNGTRPEDPTDPGSFEPEPDPAVARFLPPLVASKIQAACSANPLDCPADETGGYRGAHIIWDGLADQYDPDCPYPKDSNGNNIPADENGKPLYNEAHPNPACYYNAYKFDTTAADNPRKTPEWWFSCIDANNEFSEDSLAYANFRGTKGANAALALALGSTPTPAQLAELQEFPAVLDITPHRCVESYGSNLDLLPPVIIPRFVPSGDFDPEPTAEEVAALCDVELTPGVVNFDAFAVDCPTLDQYNLFADAADPRSAPNSGGVPFVLNSKLFSDYSLKYRVLFLPPGTKAAYRDAGGQDGNTAIAFPVGTIIAKTFAFNDGGDEESVETRLLIKRTTRSGSVRWAGTAYVWEDDGNGGKVARLARSGGTANVSWDYQDPETAVSHQGSTANYLIPSSNQCLSCHANLDGDPGAAPIGTKVRNLNRPYRSESPVDTAQGNHPIAGLNQIKFLCDNNIMAGCPDDLAVDGNSQIATAVEYVPKFNVPGSSGNAAGSDEDIEARARAWLEVNCQHCHNPKGFAANTGFYLDVFRPVDSTYGICKGPTAAGSDGSGGREVDIHPGAANLSILDYRIGPTAQTAAARMPPLARSVVDVEAHALIQQWIDNVVVADESKYPGSTSCAN